MTNLILDSVDSRVIEDLALRRQSLRQSQVLFETGAEISNLYFPNGAAVSLVVGLSTGSMIEAAMVGRDGVVGGLAALDGRKAVSRGIVQIAGEALVSSIPSVKRTAANHEAFRKLLIRHEQTLYAQAQQSAACNISHDIHARLCRWLLRARDMSGSNYLALTQEFLSEMLGVDRSSVSIAAHLLQNAGVIKYSRGKIQILDVEALEESSCECYEVIKRHYAELTGTLSNKD